MASDPPSAAALSTQAIGQINAELSAGAYDEALRLADLELDSRPEFQAIWIKRGTALRALGRHDDARAHFEQMVRHFPTEAGALFQLANAHRNLGDHKAALRFERAVLDLQPDHPGALQGQISSLWALKDLEGLIGAADQALAQLPGDGPEARNVILRRAVALRRLGRPAEALEPLRALCARSPDDLELLQELAAALRSNGDLDEALARDRDILARQPDHRGALLGQVNTLLVQSQFLPALELIDQALTRAPQDRTLLVKRGIVQRALGHHAQAVAQFQDLLAQFPGDVAIRHELALSYRAASDFEAALALHREVLAEQPDHAGALQGQIDVLLARGNYAEAQKLLQAKARVKRRVGARRDPGETRHRLKMVEIAQHLDGSPDAQSEAGKELDRNLRYIERYIHELNERELWRLFSICEKIERPKTARKMFTALIQRPTLPRDVALYIVRRLQSHQMDQALDQLMSLLEPRLSATEVTEFVLEVAAIRQGPIAALRAARHHRQAERTQSAALQLAGFLCDAGEAVLAGRYLRLCRRKWPQSFPVIEALVHALLESGAPEQALRHLRQVRRVADDHHSALEYLTGQVFLELGNLAEVEACLARVDGKLAHDRTIKQRISLEISRGDVTGANALFDAMAKLPGSSVKLARHKSISMIGSQINEMGLYYHERLLNGIDAKAPPRDPEEVLRYTHPAKRVVERMLRVGQRPLSLCHDLPMQVVQYWNNDDIPPDIAGLIGEWDRICPLDSVLFNRLRAMRFLQDNLGPDWLSAFRLARHPAEESDFFRLCYLLVQGGIYVDADDRYVRDFSALIDTCGGFLAFAEPYGTAENNFIAARPGHPAIEIAALAARDALLQRASEITWSKTGPALLTRAVAHHILRHERRHGRLPGDVTILPRYRLRPYIQIHIPLAYKKTARYWNAASRVGPITFQEMMARIVEKQTRNQR